MKPVFLRRSKESLEVFDIQACEIIGYRTRVRWNRNITKYYARRLHRLGLKITAAPPSGSLDKLALDDSQKNQQSQKNHLEQDETLK